jgi:hypothetical protein
MSVGLGVAIAGIWVGLGVLAAKTPDANGRVVWIGIAIILTFVLT